MEYIVGMKLKAKKGPAVIEIIKINAVDRFYCNILIKGMIPGFCNFTEVGPDCYHWTIQDFDNYMRPFLLRKLKFKDILKNARH